MSLVWTFIGIAAIAITLPARLSVKLWTTLTVIVIVLAVFQTSGGRGSFGLTATYVVVFAVAITALLIFRRGTIPIAFVPLLAYLVFSLLIVWDGGSGQNGGLINILLAVAAWVVGLFAGSFIRDAPTAERGLVIVLLVVILFEFVVCLLQNFGLGIFTVTGRTLDLEGGRANGTFTHPSTVGKVLTLFMVLLFPMMRSADLVVKRLATIGVVVALAPIAISESRANFVAALAMILTWSLIQPRESGFIGRRLILPAGAGIVSLFFLNAILERFQEDPAGGQREHFMEVALIQLAKTPWFGVGPAGYIRTVGQFDALTAQGWPVHNIFVLQAVELGLIGAFFFYLPVIVVLVRAVKRIRTLGPGGDNARAVIAYVPAFVIIGATGWGLLAPAMIAFCYFVLAYASAQFDRSIGKPGDVGELAISPAHLGSRAVL